MSLEAVDGEIRHYPKRRDVFQFDDEVAGVFDNMAPRSIPMYNEVHRLHVSMFSHLLRPGAVVADVGSSTGHLFRNIEKQVGAVLAQTGITGYAVDLSDAMMSRLTKQFPSVTPVVGDMTDMQDLPQQADLAFCFYTLQFITPARKLMALDWLVRNTKVGGVLVLGQKDAIPDEPLRDLFDEEYYQFRRDNGYSQAEIDAKTAALKNSMWPIRHDQFLNMLQAYDLDYIETSRWLQFSTVACIRRK